MSAATMLDQFLDPLSRCLDAESARRVLALGISAYVQESADALAERANEGLLSDDERAEYEALIKLTPSQSPSRGTSSATPASASNPALKVRKLRFF